MRIDNGITISTWDMDKINVTANSRTSGFVCFNESHNSALLTFSGRSEEDIAHCIAQFIAKLEEMAALISRYPNVLLSQPTDSDLR